MDRARDIWTLALAALAIPCAIGCAQPDLGGADADEEEPASPVEDEPSAPRPLPSSSAPADAGAAATEPPSEPVGALRVFVTSTSQSANLGGLIGADAICTKLATAAGLVRSGATWTAWLSTKNAVDASTRLTSAGPWYLVNGELVVVGKSDLTTGKLLHAIDRDQTGAAVPSSRVWTGTGKNGRYSTNECQSWTKGSEGRYGLTTAADGDWTSAGVEDCDRERRLYCFEQR